MSPDELEARMRRVLLRLELVSNARTTVWNGGGGHGHGDVGEHDYTLVTDEGRGKLAPDDALHLRYARLWDRASNAVERALVLTHAEGELKAIGRSRGNRTREETLEARNARIVAQGEGLPARDVAVWARCGVRDVHRAREAAGRDAEHGWPVRDLRALGPTERDREILRLAQGMKARQVQRATGLSYSTVLRVLGQKS